MPGNWDLYPNWDLSDTYRVDRLWVEGPMWMTVDYPLGDEFARGLYQHQEMMHYNKIFELVHKAVKVYRYILMSNLASQIIQNKYDRNRNCC